MAQIFSLVNGDFGRDGGHQHRARIAFSPYYDLRLIYLVSHIQDDMPDVKIQGLKWKTHPGHLGPIHLTSQIMITGYMSNIFSTTSDWYAIASASKN